VRRLRRTAPPAHFQRAGRSNNRIVALLTALTLSATLASSALAHASPISQTFRSGVTLTEFSGTYEVIWPLQITAVDAVIELRDEFSTPLMQALGSDAVESPYPCPTVGVNASCGRVHLDGVPELLPGSYTLYWSVTHLDGFIEQRAIRFTIDPAWVPPTPTPSVSPTATPSPTPGPTSSAAPSSTPGPSSAPTATPAPTSGSPDSSPSTSPEASPSGQPTPSPSGGEAGGEEEPQPTPVIAAWVALLVLTVAALGLVWRRRESRATSPRQD
jgi:methionine-rich copper-binding protein CopC